MWALKYVEELNADKVCLFMNEIESAKFSFDFIYKPKPGSLKQNKESVLVEQDLNESMQHLNLQAPFVFNCRHMEYLSLKINSIHQSNKPTNVCIIFPDGTIKT